MPFYINPSSPLPRFRADLILYKGPIDQTGAPTFSLFDPVRGQYYKINWQQALILQCVKPGMSLNELYKEINTRTVIHITHEEIKVFFDDAVRYNLLEIKKPSDQLIREHERTKVGFFKKVFYKYLYFRFPLVKPDKFLRKTLPYVKFLASPIAFFFYIIISITGILILINKFDEYVNTFTYFFNLNGLFIYLAGIIFFKIIHELAHAYTAAYYKVHIPTMGIAFILLIPVLYTDTTDGWKLAKRNQRLMISAAGLLAELVLAGLSTFGWAMSSPGYLQSLFFVVSSALWLTSIMININPAMRYDGYYLFSDWLGIDNLQSRAFTFTRWWIYRIFFGLQFPCPEEHITKKRKLLFILYSIYTWLYRIIFFTSIAIFTYLINEQAKIIAILIFAFTIYTLVLSPLISEIIEIIKLGRKSKKVFGTLFLTGLFAFFLFFPFPHSLHLSSIAVPVNEQTIYAPENSKIEEINVKRGQKVEKDYLLIKLSSTNLVAQILELQTNKEIKEKEIARNSLNKKNLSLFNENTKELQAIKVQLERLYHIYEKLKVYAKINGDMISLDKDLRIGQYVNKGAKIGLIAEPDFKIIAFLPESDLPEIYENQKTTFISNRSLEKYKGYIQRISPIRSEYLEHPALASVNRGNLPVIVKQEKKDNNLKLQESFYLIEMKLDHPDVPLLIGEQGILKVAGSADSYFNSLRKYAQRIFWRESSI